MLRPRESAYMSTRGSAIIPAASGPSRSCGARTAHYLFGRRACPSEDGGRPLHAHHRTPRLLSPARHRASSEPIEADDHIARTRSKSPPVPWPAVVTSTSSDDIASDDGRTGRHGHGGISAASTDRSAPNDAPSHRAIHRMPSASRIPSGSTESFEPHRTNSAAQ